MLDLDKTLELFSFMSDLEGERLERCRDLCGRGLARVERRIRPEVTGPGAGDLERLHLAAAAEAYLDYHILQAGTDAGQVKVGDISLKTGDTAGGGAREVRSHFMAQAADLLLPECPIPLGVAG